MIRAYCGGLFKVSLVLYFSLLAREMKIIVDIVCRAIQKTKQSVKIRPISSGTSKSFVAAG
jgi:hypothetical protein